MRITIRRVMIEIVPVAMLLAAFARARPLGERGVMLWLALIGFYALVRWAYADFRNPFG